MRGMLRTLVEEALGAEASAQVTAGPYERTAERTGYRNGSYRRDLMTVRDNGTPNADSIKRIFCEIADAMNRSWRGTTLQAISTTDEA
jgi:hypothetical protein